MQKQTGCKAQIKSHKKQKKKCFLLFFILISLKKKKTQTHLITSLSQT